LICRRGAPDRWIRDYLLSASVGFPGHVRGILAGITADSFVFSDIIAQVEMPQITRGRCVLIGDAAHCSTFMSGMGSSLALQDAHTLAGCLARSADEVPVALSRYAERMTPIAHRYRDTARSMRGVVLGRSRLKAQLRDLAVRWTPEWLLERKLRSFVATERPLAEVTGTSHAS
jgi:2-polyprenyl-6-methoxyphenol hydroxylase-like FAD-dependent oxidoreductase